MNEENEGQTSVTQTKKGIGTGVLVVLLVVMLVVGAGIGLAVAYVGSNNSTPKSADVTVSVVADLRAGSDNQTHDTFVPSNLTVYEGQTVNITFVNYDDMPHSFTSTALGVNFQIPGSESDGVPSVTHYSFTASKAGVYRYWCITPCDQWAMAADPVDGQPGMVGFMGGFVTVLAAS